MQIIPVPCLYDNYSYLVCNQEGTEGVVIDPGEAYPILMEAEKRKIYLSAVLCTHHHNDHIGGLNDLLDNLPNLDVYAFYSDEHRVEAANHLLTDRDEFTVASLTFRSMHTPGHTTGSVCYLVEDCLFTGDTVFGAGVGRLFEGTAEEMYSSLYDRVLRLSTDTKLFFGHEYTLKNLRFAQSIEPENLAIAKRIAQIEDNTFNLPSTIAIEMDTNPFFRCNEVDVVTRARHNGMLEAESGVQVFSALRRMRDEFE